MTEGGSHIFCHGEILKEEVESATLNPRTGSAETATSGDERPGLRPARSTAPRLTRTSRRERTRTIVSVLARHGFDLALDRLPFRHYWTFRPNSPDSRPLPVHLREALEELGTTFIKLGQLLSTHADLLPPGYLAELSKLQDAGPSVEVGLVKGMIEAELGKPVRELFAEFDPTPLGAASIAQVHAARLFDGRKVVVKVRKPEVCEQVELDLEILEELGRRLLRRLPDAGQFDPEGLIEEFARSIRAELDFTREGRNNDLFRKIFDDEPAIRIPQVHWSLTSSGVITQERLRGIKVDDDAGLAQAGIDRHELALRCTGLIFEQVFEHGVFHADPHPGNMLVLEDRALGLIDFGMVGRLDELARDCLLRLVAGALDADVDSVIDALERLGLAVRPAERVRLRRDLDCLLDTFRDESLERISLAEIIDRGTGLLRRYRLRLPPELALMLRALAMVEGVGRRLDPGYVVTTAVEPYLHRALDNRLHPSNWGKRLSRSAMSAARLGLDLPVQIERLLGRIDRGEQELGWRPDGFQPVLAALNAMVNRLALSILVSAFVIGVGVLLLSLGSGGWTAEVIRALLGLGLLAVLVLGGMLALNLWRSRGE